MLCSLRVLLWCTMAQWAVRKPPSVILLYDLVSQGQQLTQVDHNLLDTLGSMAKRASLWEASVRDAFRGPAENADSLIDVDTLQKLLEEAKHIPVLLSLEPKVVAALDDGGNRYCLCRGPNDGTFMVQCDDCDQWFHGSCVNLKVGYKALNTSNGYFGCCTTSLRVPIVFFSHSFCTVNPFLWCHVRNRRVTRASTTLNAPGARRRRVASTLTVK